MEIILDKISGHTKQGKICKVHVSEGDNINLGDKIISIESNKGSVDFKSTVKGIIKSLKVNVGDMVNVGQVIAMAEVSEISTTSESASDSAKAANKNQTSSPSTFNYMANLLKPKKEETECKVVVLGGGPGGYVAAIEAAKLGAKVILIEKEHLGGTCLNHGCIPTKVLVRSAEVYSNTKNGAEFGIEADNVKLNLPKVLNRKNKIVDELKGGIGYILNKRDVRTIYGEGKILDKSTVFVKEGNKEITIKAENIIIATGSESIILPIKGHDLPGVITSKEALNLDKLPETMVIIGGGVIGMEFAFVYAEIGCKVTVIEYFDSILATLDKDVIEVIEGKAKELGIKLYTGAKAEEIIKEENNKLIVSFSEKDEKKFVTGDKVLMSVGRKPVMDKEELKNIGIALTKGDRAIEVNDKMQTSADGIYAIGDVTNKLQLAHVASHQGVVAVKNIMGQETSMDYSVVPSAIFTSPEIAVVGITEKEALSKSMEIEVGTFPFAANGKALIYGESSGFVKIIKDKNTGVILGGAIIGPHATDLIAEIALAVKNKLTDENIIETIHAHPTTAESLHEAALELHGGAIHFVK
ncbi:dihydrolipoamide dehydrogenase [Clostridium amylolyticum]|uniref:Dihydrolipoyl dehydrogenase n=1 Tax=Clostridium amylolyticum TaxID=1121298 RepID=A0A1M6PCV7_9CLOT|nr:dihydrolipoyl dehydrogenase [Clostridium amylolyticum]SHK05779.1 dihydrolipoamide dehydrogenase [Clostridium amylolyticum]